MSPAEPQTAPDCAVLARLEQVILARKQALAAGADPSDSHTMRLLAKGSAKCAEKFGEEAIEAIIEAVRGDRDRLAAEAADVLYHLLLTLAATDTPLAAVTTALAAREGMSGVAEKRARSGGG